MTVLYDHALHLQNGCRQQYEHHLRYVASYMNSPNFLQQEHHTRIHRVHLVFNQIIMNRTRRFAGTALPYTSGLGSIEVDWCNAQGYPPIYEPAATYYTDGAMGDNQHEEQDGLLTSAVSCHDGMSWQPISCSPEWQTGNLSTPRWKEYASRSVSHTISFAARPSLLPACLSITNIVILTDCRDIADIFTDIRTEKVLGCILDPLQHQYMWDLDGIYELAAKLEDFGAKVVLAWVKVHRSGTCREGTRVADAACSAALRSTFEAAK
jgi:hypothetical protein